MARLCSRLPLVLPHPSSQIKNKTSALSGLKEQLLEMKAYLENVLAKKLPANNQILYNMQTVFNLLPNLNVDELVKSLLVKTNDMHLVIYVSSLIRCVVALHDLVKNKLLLKDEDPWSSDAKKGEEKKGAKAEVEKAAEEKSE